HIQRNAAGDALVERRALLNRDFSRQTQLQQLAGGKLSTPFTHSHDDAIDVFALDDVVQVLGQADHSGIYQALAQQLSVSADKTGNAITSVGSIQHFTRQLDRKIA